MWSHSKKWAGNAVGALGLYTLFFLILKNVTVTYRLRQLLPELPSVSFDYGTSPYNASKVALLIENRPLGLLAPLLLHMVAVLPPDWRFLFLGSDASIDIMENSAAIRRQVAIGKLDLKLLPTNVSIGGQEDISRFFTELWVYQHLFWPAEWLLVYQTDSMMCASNKGSVDDWLEYDWVGAPWYGDSRYGGNGGLSLRRVSSIITVLQNQRRQELSEPEDVWLTERLGHLPNSRVANGSESLKFSGESIWYEEPLGYHTGGGGGILAGGVWGTQERRQHIWNYCPEMKMTLDMDAAQFMPERCLENWVIQGCLGLGPEVVTSKFRHSTGSVPKDSAVLPTEQYNASRESPPLLPTSFRNPLPAARGHKSGNGAKEKAQHFAKMNGDVEMDGLISEEEDAEEEPIDSEDEAEINARKEAQKTDWELTTYQKFRKEMKRIWNGDAQKEAAAKKEREDRAKVAKDVAREMIRAERKRQKKAQKTQGKAQEVMDNSLPTYDVATASSS